MVQHRGKRPPPRLGRGARLPFREDAPAGLPLSPYAVSKGAAEGETLRLTGDGSQTRDFTYVDDIARGTVAAAGRRGFAVVNLGTGTPASLVSVIGRLERVPPHAADLPETAASTERARELLGWTAAVGLDEGLERLVRWYRENRAWAAALAG